jgi:hypothetical protein
MIVAAPMKRLNSLFAFATVALIVVACAGGAGSPSQPSTSPSPSPVTIITSEQAAARVAEVEPGLAGIGPEDPNMIGGCCFWEAVPSADGFEVMFEVGWGDCQAGCIDRHRWTYRVSRDGSVILLGESGPAVPSGVPGPGGGSTGGILPGATGIQGRVLAGPVCPVVTLNDPSCNDRPVSGATIIILDARGTEVARLLTDSDGRYGVTLPAGQYTIEPQPVEGFMHIAEPVAVTVGNGVASVDLAFDTGIR